MFKIWVRMKGSVSGTIGHYYTTRKGVYRTTCREKAKLKCFALYGEARKSSISGRYDFKVVEVI